MIVTCEHCQTRSKVPDEKIAGQGIKVRCSKCNHTFRVEGQSAADAAVDNPFDRFGPQGENPEEPVKAPLKSAGRPVGSLAPTPVPFTSGPSPLAPAGDLSGFFDNLEDEAVASPSRDDVAAARAMFDLPAPAPPPEAGPQLLDVPDPESEIAQPYKMSVERQAPRLAAQASKAPVVESNSRRTALSVGVNVMLAALLVTALAVFGSVYFNEGKFSKDTFSLEGLKNAVAPASGLLANDVSNGLYETHAGRSVFYVRGEVINQSGIAAKVVVKAEIVEDDTVVRMGETWAGNPPTPEELFLLDGADAAEALNRKVQERAQVIAKGASSAFVVPFIEYPPDLTGFRVRVSARTVVEGPLATGL